ncbi:MAG TPA: hypothetical protein ENI94_13915 [Gammaproteobacteria bacterium]|nr:hypothetical protein [Gammaproteobacteria bacterium]
MLPCCKSASTPPSTANDDVNEGWIVGGRVDFHPFDALKFSQGDFSGKQKATAAFNWSNDGDNNDPTRSKPDSA